MILELLKKLLTGGHEPRPATGTPNPGAVGSIPTPLANTSQAARLTNAIRKHGKFFTNPGELNILYIEGVNPDLSKNNNIPNDWNDLRLVLDSTGAVLGKWRATVNPGRYWVENRMNSKGAANTHYGQYTSWKIGYHRGDHEALVQTGGTVVVDRDANEDFERDGDPMDRGFFGINQHWGYDQVKVDKASAGCLVGQSREGHKEFMKLVKSDVRYQQNKSFIFTSTIIPSKDI